MNLGLPARSYYVALIQLDPTNYSPNIFCVIPQLLAAQSHGCKTNDEIIEDLFKRLFKVQVFLFKIKYKGLDSEYWVIYIVVSNSVNLCAIIF